MDKVKSFLWQVIAFIQIVFVELLLPLGFISLGLFLFFRAIYSLIVGLPY